MKFRGSDLNHLPGPGDVGARARQPGEGRPRYVECPKCGDVYDLDEGPVRECGCGYEFTGEEETF
jgi:hypothetical protein